MPLTNSHVGKRLARWVAGQYVRIRNSLRRKQ
jgi:hypothetical protein